MKKKIDTIDEHKVAQTKVGDESSTLKEYVSLKEKEIVALQQDLTRAKEQLGISETRATGLDFEFKKMREQYLDFQKKVERVTKENEELREKHAKELQSREQQIQTKSDKLIVADRKADIAQKKYDELKDRVKRDIKHIRVREKELEARLEIVKRDSETLLSAKDRKLLEFRRKIDSLEYEIETLQEKEELSQKKVNFWKGRMERVLRALKLGASLLEADDEVLDLEVEESLKSVNPVKKIA